MGGPITGAAGGLTAPCTNERRAVETACREADRLSIAAAAEAARLREARAARLRLDFPGHPDAELADSGQRQRLKEEAHRAYRQAVQRARDAGAVAQATATWWRTVDELNRRARSASRPRMNSAIRMAELDAAVERLETAADAARVAAAAAAERCTAARARLAACEESHASAAPAPAAWHVPGSTMSRLLAGDAAVLDYVAGSLAATLAGDIVHARFLVAELCDQIRERALEASVLTFPVGHPFWSQLPTEDGRLVAAALARFGNGFDGRSGWAAGHAADARTMASALAYAGYDPRSLRHAPLGADLDGLWEGTALDVDSFLVDRASALAVDQLAALLGPRGRRLDALWDNWGRIRPLLVRPFGGAATAV